MDNKTLTAPALRILAHVLALVWGAAVSAFAFTFFRDGNAPVVVQALAFLPLLVALLALASQLLGGAFLAALGPATLITGGWYLAQHVEGNRVLMLPVLAVAAVVPVFAGWVMLSTQEVRHPYRVPQAGGH